MYLDKASKGWWLRAVQEYGQSPSPKISLKDRFEDTVGITLGDVVEAYQALVDEDLVFKMGNDGSYSYELNSIGQIYLNSHSDEWTEEWNESLAQDDKPVRRITIPETPVYKTNVLGVQSNGRIRIKPDAKKPGRKPAAPAVEPQQTVFEVEPLQPEEDKVDAFPAVAHALQQDTYSQHTKSRVREVLADILIEKYGDQVTAKELYDRL